MNNPTCPKCGHRFAWLAALKQILGPSPAGSATWGAVCPSCAAKLKVPNARVMLIVAAAIFFGSQSSTLLLLENITLIQMLVAKLVLILGFYAIAVFFFLKLELVE